MNDLSKLPKWAQKHVQNLERGLAELRKELNGMLKPCETGEALLAIPGEKILEARELPSDEVEINLPNMSLTIQASKRDNEVVIRETRCCGKFVVLPDASNAITLKVFRDVAKENLR